MAHTGNIATKHNLTIPARRQSLWEGLGLGQLEATVPVKCEPVLNLPAQHLSHALLTGVTLQRPRARTAAVECHGESESPVGSGYTRVRVTVSKGPIHWHRPQSNSAAPDGPLRLLVKLHPPPHPRLPGPLPVCYTQTSSCA